MATIATVAITVVAAVTNTPLRGKPVAMLNWVRAEAAASPDLEVPAQVVTVEVDEMWHFIKKVCQTLDLVRLRR